MGYVRDTTYRLTFEEIPDLEVRMQSLTIEEYIAFGEFSTDPARAGKERLFAQLDMLADKLIDWNVQTRSPEGVVSDVPATYDGIKSQDIDFVNRIIEAWIEAMSGVSVPLGEASTGGQPSVEAYLPMEPLPVHLAS